MKALYISLFLIICSGLSAQQAPQYSHYVFNQFQLNPALAGDGDCLDLRFGFRRQWVGIDESPNTVKGSMHTAVGKASRSGTYHGVGIKFEQDEAARFSQSIVQLAYAYHFKLGRETEASIGLFAGFNATRTDLNGNRVQDPTTNEPDPILTGSSTGRNFIIPEISPGFWMHNESAFLGISIKHAFPNKWIENEDGLTTGKLVQHLNLTAGKAYSMGNKTSIIPSIRVGYAAPAPLAIDLNAMLDFNQRFAIGAGYRNGDAVIAMMKLNFANYFTLGYAYDITTSALKQVSSNTHEVVLAISACPAKAGGRGSKCAAYD